MRKLQEIRDKFKYLYMMNEKYNILKQYQDAYLSEMGDDMSSQEFKRLCKEFSTMIHIDNVVRL